MPEKKFLKRFRVAKLIQLCLYALIDIAFITILILNPQTGTKIYHDKTLFLLCTFIWVTMVLGLGYLLYDFYKMKFFAKESHSLNRTAYLDNMTGIPNRHGLDMIFDTYSTTEALAEVGCFVGTIANLREINETLGHQAGDFIIQSFCTIFEEVGDAFGTVGRNGGNEFVMVINHCTPQVMQSFLDSLDSRIEQYNNEHSDAPIKFLHSYLLNAESQAQTFAALLTATYNNLHT